MREKADNEILLVRYLLGDLCEEQRLEVEGKFLGDDQHFERLLALENELFYDYALGKMSPGAREQFEKRFLAGGPNRIRAMIASALAGKCSEDAPVKPAETVAQLLWKSRQVACSSQGSVQGRGQGRGQGSGQGRGQGSGQGSGQGMAMRISLVALAVVLLVAVGLAIGIISLKNEFNQFRTLQAVQEERLQRQAQDERASADELNLRLKREMDENAKLKQGLSRMKAQSSSQLQSLASEISLVLAPSFARDQATGMKRLYLPPDVRIVKLNLSIKGETEYKSYQVKLLTVDGAERWSQGRLMPKNTGSGQAI